MNWTLRLMSCSPCILAWNVNDGELSVSYFSLIRLNYIMNDFYLLQRVKCEIINSAMMRFVCSLAAFFFFVARHKLCAFMFALNRSLLIIISLLYIMILVGWYGAVQCNVWQWQAAKRCTIILLSHCSLHIFLCLCV